jgi:hypothetical protein
MNFKLISKNNVGAVATLFLVILLSHSRFFDFLVDTTLGRAILILFILGISCMNKIFGIVAVLFIIISFNNSDIGYLEGFNNNSPNTKEKKDEVKEKVAEKKPESKKPVGGGFEGSNMTEREGMMLRGKRSSEVPVYSNARNQNDDVEPSDKSVFAGNYSSV